jgi:saccharopine dehydrogenase (NADP+, L-glutamate forming)
MKKIFVIGAGLSSSCLINYLLDQSQEYHWQVTVGDLAEEAAKMKVKNHPNGRAIKFDIFDKELRETEIKNSDVVISMLPARYHGWVARDAIRFGKNMITASYVSDEIRAYHEEAIEKGLLILNEFGVDPGIDHMSAMQIIDRIKEQGGKILSFSSCTGGLIAPRYDNNPWNYKFTWNPRNVIVAGQGTAKVIKDGNYKYIPYHKLFQRIKRTNVLNYGEFEIYPNRDSLNYRSTYGLDDIPTMYRGTMRRPGFCKAWNVFVQLGATSDMYTVENSENMTYREFINVYIRSHKDLPVEKKLADYLGINEDSGIMYKLRWLGIFENRKIGLKNATPAQILRKLCEEKWKFEEDDRDMIVMQHKFEYELNNKKKQLTSSMVVEGQDHVRTAMAMTVGIPVGIATKMLLTDVFSISGVQIPIKKEIYNPVLKELEEYGIKFIEEEQEIFD